LGYLGIGELRNLGIENLGIGELKKMNQGEHGGHGEKIISGRFAANKTHGKNLCGSLGPLW
jgi:hypothetical protein